MRHDRIYLNGRSYQQIYRPTAKKLYDKGKKIYMLPCLMNPHSPWVSLFGTDNKLYDGGFDALDNEFQYYNCNKDQGESPNYFIEITN